MHFKKKFINTLFFKFGLLGLTGCVLYCVVKLGRFILRQKMKMGRIESTYWNKESQHKLVIYYNKPRISPLKKCLTMNKQLPPLIIKIDRIKGLIRAKAHYGKPLYFH